MPRKPSFRRDADLQKEVRRVNKLVQNKQSRIRMKTGLETVDVHTSKYKEFNSRKEINTYLNEMNQFLEKKANFNVKNEHGVTYDYQEDVRKVERRINNVNKQKEKQWNQMKDLPYKHRGVPTGLTVGQQANPLIGMGDPKYSDYKPVSIDFNIYQSKGDFLRRKAKILDRYDSNWLQKVNQSYKDNYIKAIDNNLGWEGRHIAEHVKNMDMDEFMKHYFTENNANIKFLYDKVQIQAKVKELERILGVSG